MGTTDEFATENLTVKATERYSFGLAALRPEGGAVEFAPPSVYWNPKWHDLYRRALAAAKEGA